MKRILGLDLGTNSIGWALIEIDHEAGTVRIIGLGSRILPMDAGEVKKFAEGGKIKSGAAQRTEYRGPRRLNERFLLRRDRLHLVLNLLGALPEHYKLEIDLTNTRGEKSGQFKKNTEPKLAYLPKKIGGKAEFLFKQSYQEMLNELGIENKKGNRIPYDWTLYYLRKKALKDEISLNELAWVLLSYNQKRGYEKVDSLDEFDDLGKKLEEFGLTKSIQQSIDSSKLEIESLVLKVKNVVKCNDVFGMYYEIHLENGYMYKEYSTLQVTELNEQIDEVKMVERITFLNENRDDIDHSKTIYKVEDSFKLTVSSVERKDGSNKVFIKEYANAWYVNTNYSNFKRFENAEHGLEDEIFVTRLYNENGDLIKPSIKSERLTINKEKEPYGAIKILDPNNATNWKILKKKTEKEALQFNSLNGYVDQKTNDVKKYISPKIYNILKSNAVTGDRTKIIGGLFQVVDRAFYREELEQIIETQRIHHKALEDVKLFKQCVDTLYPKNRIHANALLANKKAIEHLLVEDILLYQRPLKSKKSEISNCKHEIGTWKEVEKLNKATGELTKEKEPIYRKVVSTSHPYFQEFRIWDKLHNLRVIQLERIDEETGKTKTNVDITKEVLTDEAYLNLFNKLNNSTSINQKQFLKFCKKKEGEYVWNFPDDDEIKGNETRVSFITRFKRCGFNEYDSFLTQEKEVELWHYLYSVGYRDRIANDNKSLDTFLTRFFEGKNVLKENMIRDFANYPSFSSKYCAYSEKALKKLTPLIHKGAESRKYHWTHEEWYQKWERSLDERKTEILHRLQDIDFDQETIDYSKAIDVESSIPFPKGLFNAFRNHVKMDDFVNLNLTQASYLIYGRHSELAHAKYWESPEVIRMELHNELKQHSLNNPVAEKVILETMQVVADIWDFYGNGAEKYFSKIHLELGRELKKSSKEKAEDTERMTGNRSQNKRIRQILEEHLKDSNYNANSKNSDHFERLKIAEDGAEHTSNNKKDFYQHESLVKGEVSKKGIEEILKKPRISKDDFVKYKLWIEQGYRSPYSGQMIKLTDLFDREKYNVDHIFPQASVTNNSLSNKVVCETALNQLKRDRTAREFIQDQKGKEYLKIPVCNEAEFLNLVKKQFSGTKRFTLLAKEIPAGFTSSQLNNARHIARKAMELLSHIVREPGEVEYRSKNVLPVSGRITSDLKKAWQLNEVWTELMSPRFIRMNELTKSKLFGEWQTSKEGHRYFDCNLDQSIREKDENFDIKRIDHRHHALDALIVALCTEEHVNYINNINSEANSNDFGTQRKIEKYRSTLKRKIKYSESDKVNPSDKNWYYMRPGEIRKSGELESSEQSVLKKQYHLRERSFDANWRDMTLEALQGTIVTFKQNLRVINSTVNRYWAYKDIKGNQTEKKQYVKQKNEKESNNKHNWAIRRSLGKKTYYGSVFLKINQKSKLHNVIERIFKDDSLIVDKKLKREIQILKENNDLAKFKLAIKEKYSKNAEVELYDKKLASREELSENFGRNKIATITDSGIQKILVNQLKQFDTVKVPLEKGILYYDALLEKDELDAIVNNKDNAFKTTNDLLEYLKLNNYKFNKIDYSLVNIFIHKVEKQYFTLNDNANGKIKIEEHPEIAFTAEAIDVMNRPEELLRLNEGKHHMPIKKVRVSTGFGKQRALNEEDKQSVKFKQYVVNDAGSNLYLGVYGRTYLDNNGIESTERKFKDIGLIELLETLKQDIDSRYHPLPHEIYDNQNSHFERLFTLSPLDLVFVPLLDEIATPSKVDFKNLTKDQSERIYKYVDGSEEIANFVPHHVSKPIWRFHGKSNKEIYRELKNADKIVISEKELIQNEFGLGSQQNKNQNMIDGLTQVKKICWKIRIDRLGNISRA